MSSAALTVSVVVPTLNERANIAEVLERMPAGLLEVIVVDGHSDDGTREEVKRARPDARVLLQQATGKGDALGAGFAAARGDIVVMIDADGSNRPEEIPVFIGAIRDGADMAKGSRFVAGGGSRDITPVRQLGNRIFCGLVNVLYGSDYTDLCYGYNAFRSSCLEALDVTYEGFEVEALLAVQALKAGLRIVEVPSLELARSHGESNLRPVRDGLRILRIIITERLGWRSGSPRGGPQSPGGWRAT